MFSENKFSYSKASNIKVQETNKLHVTSEGCSDVTDDYCSLIYAED